MNKKINLITITSLILGIIAGFTMPNIMNKISFLGSIYINLLKFIIVPILITNIIVSVYKLPKNRQITKLLIKIIVTFLIMFILTFILTSTILMFSKIGVGYNFIETDWQGKMVDLSLGGIVTKLFPSNIVTMISSDSIFAIILFATVFGICANKVSNGGKVIEIIEILQNIFNKIFELIMYLTPLAVFSLIGVTVANYGNLIMSVGAKYILISYLCGLLTMFFIMILPVWIIAKINPITYIRKVCKVWIISSSTCSSLATLPTTIKVCNDEFNVPKRITDLVVPLGCTINMCGGAVSFALLGIFCSQMYGVELNLINYLVMLIVAIIINMAAPGIPGGGIILGATYLMLLNIPITFIGFYSGIYRLLDINYTTLNVTGDITANIIINKTIKNEKLLQ